MGIKLEAGKYYRTRGASRVYVAAVAEIPAGAHTTSIFTVLAFAPGHSILYTAEGHYSLAQVSPWDILYEWQEPLDIIQWAVVCTVPGPRRIRGEVLASFSDKRDAMDYVNSFEASKETKVALVELTGTLEC